MNEFKASASTSALCAGDSDKVLGRGTRIWNASSISWWRYPALWGCSSNPSEPEA